MRFSLSTGSFYHRGLGYSFELARAAGYDGVEVVLSPRFALGGVAAIARAARARGVRVLSVHPPFFPWPGWPRRLEERIPRVAMIAQQLGAQVAVCHIHPFTRMASRHAARFETALRQARAVAGTTTIAIETNQYSLRHVRFPLDDPQALADYAREHDCGVTLDTTHAGANGEDILKTYEILRPVLRNVHLSDVQWVEGRPRTHAMPGEGTVPLREFLAALARDGYDGLVTLELHPREVSLFDRARAEARLRQALAFCHEAVALTPSTHSD